VKVDKEKSAEVGNLVKHIFSERKGIIINLANDRLARQNKSFDVLWTDGKIGYNVWDYDLIKVVTDEGR
jgi:hypothetical protein